MKKIITLFGLCFWGVNLLGQTLEIQDAISKKQIEYNIEGSWNSLDKQEFFDADGQYFGKCLKIKIRNKNKASCMIYIPNGLMLMCEDTVTQDMIITKPIYVNLNPRQTKVFQLYAMCSEIHDGMPNKLTKYRVGKMADENLVTITKTINDKFMQNIVGQGAIWAYTDKATKDDLTKYGATENSLDLTIGILNNAGVTTKINPQPTKIIDSTFIQTSEISLEENSGKNIVALNKSVAYSACGVIFLLLGSTLLLLFKNRKNDSDKQKLV